MTDTTTEFVGWNMLRQTAIDIDDNVWLVGGWYDKQGKELPMAYTDWNSPPWSNVDYVTVYRDTETHRLWSTIRPDDFTNGTN